MIACFSDQTVYKYFPAHTLLFFSLDVFVDFLEQFHTFCATSSVIFPVSTAHRFLFVDFFILVLRSMCFALSFLPNATL